MTFHVGQKVVCVSELVDPKWDEETYPKKGLIYTVRGVFEFDDKPYLLLEEIVNPRRYDQEPEECVFWAFRFRPVTERKTDIAIFEKMLTDAPLELEAADVRT